MPLYVTPILGTGGDRTDSFRPIGLEQPGMGWVDLRPDQTVSTGRGLLWLPVHDPDIRLIRLADAPGEALTLTRRTQLANALGLTLSGSKFADLAAEILGRNARTDGTRWRPLTIRPDGIFEIWLGSANSGKPIWVSDHLAGGMAPWFFAALGFGLRPQSRWGRREFLIGAGLALSLLMPRRVLAAIWSESWPTNSTTISSGQDQPWNEDTGDVEVVAGKLQQVTLGGVAPHARCLSSVAADNHDVQADLTIPTRDANFRQIRVVARKEATTNKNYYGIEFRRNTGGDLRALMKNDQVGGRTVLSSDTTDSGTPVTARIRVSGSTIVGYQGGSQILIATDTSITGNLQGGVLLDEDAAPSGQQTVDGWSISDSGVGFGAFGPVPLRTILGVGQ